MKRLTSDEKDKRAHQSSKRSKRLIQCVDCLHAFEESDTVWCRKINKEERHRICRDCSRVCMLCQATTCLDCADMCEICRGFHCYDCADDSVEGMHICDDYGKKVFGCFECHGAVRKKRRIQMQLYFALALKCPPPVVDSICHTWDHTLAQLECPDFMYSFENHDL